jgi:hypothetical protein
MQVGMHTVKVGPATLSPLLIGGNPFSGFFHSTPERNREVLHYYTTARIKEALVRAERLGITGFVGRIDRHIMRVLTEYWDEGGAIQWCAQTATDSGGTEACVNLAAGMGAKICYIHGGVMDHLVATGQTDEAKRGVELMRKKGMAAGVAGHTVRVFEWAEKNLDVDFYMCCYYNPSPREDDPSYRPGVAESYREEDRQAMVKTISTLRRPAIHYKILAAGRNDPDEAFAFAARAMRPGDLVCVGVYLKDDPEMLAKDVALFEKYVGAKSGA